MLDFEENWAGWIGLILIGLPAACLVILVVSTGHQVQSGAETGFFMLAYLGALSGCLSVPIGIAFIIYALLSKNKRK